MKQYSDCVSSKMARVLCEALAKNEVTSLEVPMIGEIKNGLMKKQKGLLSTYTGEDTHVNLYCVNHSLYLQYMRHLRETLGKIERYTVAFSKEEQGVLVRGESTFSEMKRMKKVGDCLVPYPMESELPIDLELYGEEKWIEKTLSYGSMSYFYGDRVTPLTEDEARLLEVMHIYSSLYADAFAQTLEPQKQKALK